MKVKNPLVSGLKVALSLPVWLITAGWARAKDLRIVLIRDDFLDPTILKSTIFSRKLSISPGKGIVKFLALPDPHLQLHQKYIIPRLCWEFAVQKWNTKATNSSRKPRLFWNIPTQTIPFLRNIYFPYIQTDLSDRLVKYICWVSSAYKPTSSPVKSQIAIMASLGLGRIRGSSRFLFW